MDHAVFIHTNHRQYLGALVAAHSLRRQSRHADRFEVRIIDQREHRVLEAHEGREYLKDGRRFRWRNQDLQSFTPLRFAAPELMGYQGRAVVLDPDVFAVGDIWELLTRDLGGRAIACRSHGGAKLAVRGRFATSVMLLDCARLGHWRLDRQVEELMTFKRDYRRWLSLQDEDPASIAELEPVWNDFDRLAADTKLLHNTRRLTQPWKTGLPIDFLPEEHFPPFPPLGWLMTARRKLFGDYGLLGRYWRHPDRNQEALFFALLRECMESGAVSAALLQEEMKLNHLRHDAPAMIGAAPSVDSLLARVKEAKSATH